MRKGKIFYIVTFFLVLIFMSMIASAGQLKLTIDHTKIASPLSDFPVLIHLGASSGQNAADTTAVFSALGSNANRKKISVSNDSAGTQQLFVEIEKWDTASKQAWLWVKVPTISSTTDTTLYLNYGPEIPDNTKYVGETGETAANQVWSNNYVAVYHFAEQGTGVPGEYKDSTGKGHNGQGGGGKSWGEVPQRVPSMIGDGGYYDGPGDKKWDVIKVPDADDLSITTTNHFTVSCWWNCYGNKFTDAPWYNSDGYIHWLGKEKDNPYAIEWQFVLHQCPSIDDSPGIARWYQFSPSGGYGAAADSYDFWKTGEWHYQTGEVDCTDSKHGTPNAYMEDARHNVGVTTWQEYGINYQNTEAPLYIGDSMFEVTGDMDNSWWGQIDELQVSSVSRPAAWVKASYYTDKDALLNFNAPSTGGNGIFPIANCSTNTTSGLAPLSVQFTDLSKNAAEWNWDFENDGKVDSTDKNPIHEYAAPGIYTVKLVAVNENGTDSKLTTITVSENSLPLLPIADFDFKNYIRERPTLSPVYRSVR